MLGLDLPTIISRVITLVIAFTVHEFAHAWAADSQGDPTARSLGRLSLNPLVHLDPFGSLLLIIAGFGWAKPVPFNPRNLRSGPRVGTAIVAIVGPLSNLLMALVAALPFQFHLFLGAQAFTNGKYLPSLAGFLGDFIFINLILLFFNLIPLPPLDGHKVAIGLLPDSLAEPLARLAQFGPMILLLAFFVLPRLGFDLFGRIILPPTELIFRILVQ